MWSREPQLVDPLHVPRIGDGNPENALVELVRDRDDALEHAHWHRARDGLVDGRRHKVDERQPEPRGTMARYRVARRDPLVDEGAGEGARLARAVAGEGELV
jgi:hypothetical protein